MDASRVKELIANAGGKIFRVTFIKRSTNERRVMVCRLGVKSALKGGERAYDPKEHALICVFDMQKNAYRSIPVDSVEEISLGE